MPLATTVPLFIGNRAVAAGSRETFASIDPATGQQIGEVVEASDEDVDNAVRAARAALIGPWGKTTDAERAAVLRRIADGIDARADEFLAAEIADTGKPTTLASKIDIPRGAANFRIFADIVAQQPAEAYHQPLSDGHQAIHYVQREPVGVVGVICPWNLPLLLMTWKVAPALACGNTVVVKPSEETPRTATLLAEVIRDVGVPDGVYNVVHGFGPGSAGEAIVRHPDIDAITFTGESATGARIMESGAATLKHVSFELGGKNPAIVFADADLGEAIPGLARSSFTNAGQVCLCTERIYVHRSRVDEVVDGLVREAAALRPGAPHDPSTSLGPLISAEHRSKVAGFYDLAREEGAEVACGGSIPALASPHDSGFYIEPTVWLGLSDDARCAREEVFGPVCAVFAFDDEDEVIARANDTEYGLCASIWTSRGDRAMRVASQIEAGMVWVNTWFLRDLRTPFGGMKRSGIGREGGRYSLDFYSELRNVCLYV